MSVAVELDPAILKDVIFWLDLHQQWPQSPHFLPEKELSTIIEADPRVKQLKLSFVFGIG